MKTLSLVGIVLCSLVGYSQTLQDFTLPNAQDGKSVSLKDFASYKGIVIIFSSNECPYDEYYAARINELSLTFKDQVAIILVNSHTEVSESIDAMSSYLQRSGINLPYLADKSQVILNNLAPRKTPEAFLLQKKDNKYSVIYHGAIDDNAQSAEEVRNTYLKTSIEQFLAGTPLSSTEERAVGCSIKKSKN